jgi:1-deoxy-D-xylulose-5-phosphate synthase
MIFVKPLDTKLLDEIFNKHKLVITVEDNVISGGFGSAVFEYKSDKNYATNLIRLAFQTDLLNTALKMN